MTPKYNVPNAVTKNSTLLGLGSIPLKNQQRISMAIASWQEEHGIAVDGAYDFQTERSLDQALRENGVVMTPSPTPPPGAIGFTNIEVVARWLADVAYATLHATDGKAKYGLAHGADWTEPSVFSKDGLADCSAAVLHGLGVPKEGRWNTEAMVNDAFRREMGRFVLDANGNRVRGRCQLWEPVDDRDVRKGDVIVYPGPDRDHDGRRDHAGHTGGVIEVPPGFVMYEDDWEDEASGARFVHCRWKVRAMRVTGGAYFDKPGVVIIRCKRVRYV